MRSSHSRIERQRRALLAARVLIDRMRVIYGQIERLTDAPVSAQRALACIADDPGIAASQLARVLGIQRSGVSHILKLLVARNWVQRRREAEARNHQNALRRKQEKECAALEEKIHEIEAEIQTLETQLASGEFVRDENKMAELSRRYKQRLKLRDRLYAEWEALVDSLECVSGG